MKKPTLKQIRERRALWQKLTLECVQLKDRLARAGLFETMHEMDKVTNKIGYELAEIEIKLKRGVIDARITL